MRRSQPRLKSAAEKSCARQTSAPPPSSPSNLRRRWWRRRRPMTSDQQTRRVWSSGGGERLRAAARARALASRRVESAYAGARARGSGGAPTNSRRARALSRVSPSLPPPLAKPERAGSAAAVAAAGARAKTTKVSGGCRSHCQHLQAILKLQYCGRISLARAASRRHTNNKRGFRGEISETARAHRERSLCATKVII